MCALQLRLSASCVSDSTVDSNILTIDVCTRWAGQIYHDSRDVFGLTKPFTRIPVFQLLLATQHLDQAVCQFRRKEARCDCIRCDVAWSEFDSELSGKVMSSGFRDTVHDCAMLPHVWNRCAGCRRDDDDARWVLSRAGLLEEGRKSANILVSVGT